MSRIKVEVEEEVEVEVGTISISKLTRCEQNFRDHGKSLPFGRTCPLLTGLAGS